MTSRRPVRARVLLMYCDAVPRTFAPGKSRAPCHTPLAVGYMRERAIRVRYYISTTAVLILTIHAYSRLARVATTRMPSVGAQYGPRSICANILTPGQKPVLHSGTSSAQLIKPSKFPPITVLFQDCSRLCPARRTRQCDQSAHRAYSDTRVARLSLDRRIA